LRLCSVAVLHIPSGNKNLQAPEAVDGAGDARRAGKLPGEKAASAAVNLSSFIRYHDYRYDD
jgi:hypothetical protein